MNKVGKISGFPEWLPGQKLVEDRVIGTIRRVYENYGFIPIETAAVEYLSVLGAKGVIDKELYALRRAKQEERREDGGDAELGLHFDLSVPLARYVSQNYGSLSFPFKRFQCQKVWRGDRPQKGRFREFYQFDIDVIAQDELPLSCDAEILSAYVTALSAIDIGPFLIKCSNRKIMLGFFEALGLNPAQQDAARIAVDKIMKIGPNGVRGELMGPVGLTEEAASRIVAFAGLSFPPAELEQRFAGLKIANDTFAAGVMELSQVLALVDDAALRQITVDCSLARGLDYYTGIVFESYFTNHPDFGSAGGGGRYDNLTSQFINKKLPGVGASIGLTRMMDLIFANNLIPVEDRAFTRVLVTVLDEGQRKECNKVAAELRRLGTPAEVFFKSPKLGKQIDYADSRKIPYVLFLQEGGKIEVKDLRTKEQRPVGSLDQFARDAMK